MPAPTDHPLQFVAAIGNAQSLQVVDFIRGGDRYITFAGALVPLVTLGIPGAPVDALLIGAMTIHKIQPGPLLFTTHGDLVWGMIAGYFVSNLLMFAIMMLCYRQLAKVITIPASILVPVVFALCAIGAYAYGNRLFDVWVMLGFGVVGFLMERARIPIGPFVIGFVLAGKFETELRTALQLSDGSFADLFTRPVALGFILIAILMLVLPSIQMRRQKRYSDPCRRFRMKNVLVIMSDEHSRKVLGCYGDTHAITPNLDALAKRGTSFSNAYCNSPICVPSRASFHTGMYPHQINAWDNVMPYDGTHRSWAHDLQDAGREVLSFGKLHFKNDQISTGFDKQVLPLHVKDGVGDLTMLLRRDPPARPGSRKLSQMTGQGVTPYWDYDSNVADQAADWIRSKGTETGWTAFVSLVMPHYPLNAPDEFRALFDRDTLPFPKANKGYTPDNDAIAAIRKVQCYQDYFEDDDQIKEAVAHYYALVAAVVYNIGKVLKALDDAGATEDTLVIYTSDHGDNLGSRGFWGKSTLWEESVGVPLIVAGPDVPEGRVETTPVSLVDVAPTILQAQDVAVRGDLPGRDLVDCIAAPDPNRDVFAEYHAVGSATGMFMLRCGALKLIHSVGDAPLLYDLDEDPEELVNIASDPARAHDLARCMHALELILDMNRVNEDAFGAQARLIESHGGEVAIRKLEPMAFTDPSGAAR